MRQLENSSRELIGALVSCQHARDDNAILIMERQEGDALVHLLGVFCEEVRSTPGAHLSQRALGLLDRIDGERARLNCVARVPYPDTRHLDAPSTGQTARLLAPEDERKQEGPSPVRRKGGVPSPTAEEERS